MKLHCLPLCLDCFCHALDMTLSECDRVQLERLVNMLVTGPLPQHKCVKYHQIYDFCIDKNFTYSMQINQ